ncbi:MAG: DAK2 domain-containing protein [Thermotogae bacterium]|nr:DAK2 domain-containing protein [Thermotogota bacterium]
MKEIDGPQFVAAFKKALEEVALHEEELNALNVFPVPDGDTGSNMLAAMREALKNLAELEDTPSLPRVLRAIKEGTLMGARGNSGVILSQIFRGFADHVGERTGLDVREFAEALDNARKVAYRAVMKPVEGTMLTVIRMVAEEGLKIAQELEEFEDFFGRISAIAEDAVVMTPRLLPMLKEAGVVDAGAKGLYYIFEGFRKFVAGEEIKEVKIAAQVEIPAARVSEEEITYTYCTEVICKLKDPDLEKEVEKRIREYLEGVGDSVVAFAQDGILKLHVHTDHPGEVLEKLILHGELQKIKIENMRIQHQHIVEMVDRVEQTRKKYGKVAVAPSESIAKIFRSFGVDEVVLGGQTMNPSLADLKKAVEKVKAETVIILPNNSNIVLTAQQLVEHVDDKQVKVIPTESIQEGVGALMRFDESLEPEDLVEEMIDGAKGVTSLSVTYAVRDTKLNGEKIREGEYIALKGKEIVEHGEDRINVVVKAIDRSINSDHEMVTLIYGEGVDEDEVEEIKSRLLEMYPDIDVDVVFGGQPHYYYLISLE